MKMIGYNFGRVLNCLFDRLGACVEQYKIRIVRIFLFVRLGSALGWALGTALLAVIGGNKICTITLFGAPDFD